MTMPFNVWMFNTRMQFSKCQCHGQFAFRRHKLEKCRCPPSHSVLVFLVSGGLSPATTTFKRLASLSTTKGQMAYQNNRRMVVLPAEFCSFEVKHYVLAIISTTSLGDGGYTKDCHRRKYLIIIPTNSLYNKHNTALFTRFIP